MKLLAVLTIVEQKAIERVYLLRRNITQQDNFIFKLVRK